MSYFEVPKFHVAGSRLSGAEQGVVAGYQGQAIRERVLAEMNDRNGTEVVAETEQDRRAVAAGNITQLQPALELLPEAAAVEDVANF